MVGKIIMTVLALAAFVVCLLLPGLTHGRASPAEVRPFLIGTGVLFALSLVLVIKSAVSGGGEKKRG